MLNLGDSTGTVSRGSLRLNWDNQGKEMVLAFSTSTRQHYQENGCAWKESGMASQEPCWMRQGRNPGISESCTTCKTSIDIDRSIVQ